MALVVMFGRPPRQAMALAVNRPRPIDDTRGELSRRRCRARIAARRALQL
jgi:hypothetical protein